MSNINYHIKIVLSLFAILLLYNKVCFTQIIYYPKYDCLIPFTINNYSSCKMFLHEYRYGEPLNKSEKYAEINYTNGIINEYKRYFIDLGYENSRQFCDLYIKFDFSERKLSLMKFYGNEGFLTHKYLFSYKNDSIVNIKNVDSYGNKTEESKILKFDKTGFSILTLLDDEEYDKKIRQKTKDSLNSTYYFYHIENLSNHGADKDYVQITYDEYFNTQLYLRFQDNNYDDVPKNQKFVVTEKSKILYKFDEFNNPSEIIVIGLTGEPEYLLEFKYFN